MFDEENILVVLFSKMFLVFFAQTLAGTPLATPAASFRTNSTVVKCYSGFNYAFILLSVHMFVLN